MVSHYSSVSVFSTQGLQISPPPPMGCGGQIGQNVPLERNFILGIVFGPVVPVVGIFTNTDILNNVYHIWS